MEKEREEKKISKVLQEFENYLQAKEIRSRKEYMAQLNLFIEWCNRENVEPLYLSESQAQDWLVSLMEGDKPLARRTINGKLSKVKGFYSFLQRRGYIPSSPLGYIEFLKLSKTLPRDIPTPEQMETLINDFSLLTLQDRMLVVVIEILYGSGLRISEIEPLRLDDIDWTTGTMTIYENKNLLQRKVPLTQAALMAIKKYEEELRPRLLSPQELAAGYIFEQKGGTVLRARINRRLKRECSRLGLPIMTSHSFRHTVATHMLKAGAGIRQVQSFLGHQKIASTEIYTHLVKEDLKEVINSHHPREQKRRKA